MFVLKLFGIWGRSKDIKPTSTDNIFAKKIQCVSNNKRMIKLGIIGSQPKIYSQISILENLGHNWII